MQYGNPYLGLYEYFIIDTKINDIDAFRLEFKLLTNRLIDSFGKHVSMITLVIQVTRKFSIIKTVPNF